jgi:DNA-binding SARP family transcriptional activator
MRARHATGRRGAALEVYEQIRKRLADQLGADPSAELSALHLELLTEPPPASKAPSPPRRTPTCPPS